MINYDLYAVIGNPIAHSKSPLIHAAFAQQTGEKIQYEKILGDRADFPGTVQHFFATGGRGLNVTVPFKEEAWSFATECSPRADTAGAVNTLIQLDDSQVRGDNTDGIGLMRDLCDNHGFCCEGAQILLLGAGGAARGILQPLLEKRLAGLTIANRTAHKAYDLARCIDNKKLVRGASLKELQGKQFDLIIHATAAGLDNTIPDLPDNCLAPSGWVYDLYYGDTPTAFNRWGIEHGAGCVLDGLGMLVEQAAESFWLWRGVRPQTKPVINLLRAGKQKLTL